MSNGEDLARERGLTEEQRRLVLDHLWLVEDIAREMAWLAPKTLDRDVLGYAYEGLIGAARRFDPGRGTRFSSFAYKPITGAVLDGVERAHPGFTRLHRMALDACDGVPGDEAEPAGEPGDGGDPLDPAAAAVWIGAASRRWGLREGGRTAGAAVDGDAEEALERLEPDDRQLLLAYADGATWRELAEQFGTSESTVKRRVASLRKLLWARRRSGEVQAGKP